MDALGWYDSFIPMANVAKIACSIDADLLARVESVRKKTGESRSAFISRALRILTAESSRAIAVARYVEAYRECPESSEDVRAARKSAHRALSRVAWEDG
jgi:metal-responsive CopG/Arc/MetJ family transcriptional regulator